MISFYPMTQRLKLRFETWQALLKKIWREIPFITVFLTIGAIYLEGLPRLKVLVWLSRILLLAGLLICFWRQRKAGLKLKLPILIWSFFGYALLSIVWAANVKPVLAIVSEVLTLAAFVFLILNIEFTPAKWRRVVSLVYIITFYFALVTIVKACAGIGRPAFFSGQDPNIFGMYFLLAMGIQLAVITTKCNPFVFWTSLGGLTVNLLALLLTESRGDCLAFVAMSVLILAISPIRRRWLVAAGLLLAIILVLPPGKMILERFASLAIDRGSKRLDIWLIGWQMIKNNPWLGVGLSNFPIRMQFYIQSVNASATIHPGTGVHNSIIGIWAELGLVGLAFFAWIFITSLKHGWQVLRQAAMQSLPSILAKGVIAALFGVFTASLFMGGYFRKFFWLPLILSELLYVSISRGNTGKSTK